MMVCTKTSRKAAVLLTYLLLFFIRITKSSSQATDSASFFYFRCILFVCSIVSPLLNIMHFPHAQSMHCFNFETASTTGNNSPLQTTSLAGQTHLLSPFVCGRLSCAMTWVASLPCESIFSLFLLSACLPLMQSSSIVRDVLLYL